MPGCRKCVAATPFGAAITTININASNRWNYPEKSHEAQGNESFLRKISWFISNCNCIGLLIYLQLSLSEPVATFTVEFFFAPDLKISVIPSPFIYVYIKCIIIYVYVYMYICRVVNAIMSLRCCAMFLLHVQPWWSFRKSSVLRFEDIGCADALDPSLERVMMLARWQFREFCNSISKKNMKGALWLECFGYWTVTCLSW